MYCSKTLFWGLVIAGTALLAAVAVYCLARIYPPELLTPFQSTIPILAGQAGLFGSAPSFFYTFAIGLLVGTCAGPPEFEGRPAAHATSTISRNHRCPGLLPSSASSCSSRPCRSFAALPWPSRSCPPTNRPARSSWPTTRLN